MCDVFVVAGSTLLFCRRTVHLKNGYCLCVLQIVSGWNGKDTTEVVYPDIVDMVYVWRFFGR